MQGFYHRLPNLDFLRFFAASLVIFQHIELYTNSLAIDTGSLPILKVNSSLGVALFFVLSAFLITTLLLHEKETNLAISLKSFYWSRILRIWPLYYLIIFLGFLLLPHLPFFIPPFKNDNLVPVEGETLIPNLFYYLFSAPNLGKTLYGIIPYASQTWSLATEFVFYLIWPFVINLFSKRLILAILSIIILYHAFLYFLSTKHADVIPYNRFILAFFMDIKLPCMAVGGIFAVIAYKKMQLLKFIFNPVVFLTSTILTLILVFEKTTSNIYDIPLYAIPLGILISNLAINPRFSTLLENKVTNYLGRISYGLYMYHCIAIVIVLQLSSYFSLSVLVYPLTFLITVFISHFSYKYFETYFLRLKTKFAVNQQTLILLITFTAFLCSSEFPHEQFTLFLRNV